jgi:predicted alpha/beta-fold hydrolase
LARLEVSADLREALRRLARVALFVPPLVVGYAFGMAALASWLGGHWGRPAALASVAALQIVVAGSGILWSLSALGRARILERSGAEMADSVQRTIAAVSGRPGSSDG